MLTRPNYGGDLIPHPTGCPNVAFAVNTASTYTEFRYTPYVQTYPNGGGVFLFEKLWRSYGL